LKKRRHSFAGLSASERQEAEALLEAYGRQVEENPLQGYHPHSKQRPFHRSKQPLKAFFGGNRSGKTTAGIVDDLIQAIDADAVPKHLVPYKCFEPPFYCRVVNPGFDVMEGVVFEALRRWCPRSQLAGGSWEKGYEKQRRKLRFKNGSWIDFLTYEQDIDKFGGAALHRIHYDEEPPEDIRNEGLVRLIDYGGQEIFTMTPLLGMSWMFDQIWERNNKGTLKHATVVVVDMDDNPHLDEATKERLLENYSREEREARKCGRFVHFHGMIYPEFSGEDVIPEAPVPHGAKVYVGIDPGIRVMAAVVWCYIDERDVMVVFDELAMQGATIAQVCEQIHMQNLAHGREENGVRLPLLPDWHVIDPSARNISHQTGRSDQMEFTDHGVVTIAGQNSVTAGINRVKERLQKGRLKIMASCPELIDEFRRYRWSTPSRTENDPKEQPVKKDDHLLDALRYVVASRPITPLEQLAKARLTPLEQARAEFWEQIKHPRPKTPMGGVFY
jgi:phage terminase large subunit-like protein